MAQQTALSVMGTPGRTQSFVAKTPAADVVWRTLEGVFNYFAARYGAAISFYFEVSLLATVGTARARLYSLTTSTAVSGSELSTASSTVTRLRSGALTLVDANDYHLQIGKEGSDAGIAEDGKVIAY